MTENTELQSAILRIRQMENYLDAITGALQNNPDSLRENAVLKAMICELSHYYQSGQWLQDYDRDAVGELPSDLKRGVLAQDTLYDLLSEIDQKAG